MHPTMTQMDSIYIFMMRKNSIHSFPYSIVHLSMCVLINAIEKTYNVTNAGINLVQGKNEVQICCIIDRRLN